MAVLIVLGGLSQLKSFQTTKGWCTIGYTHHFKQTKAFSHRKWKSLCDFVERLSHYKPTICGPDGQGHPVITETDIMFNGDVGIDQSCETFHVSKNVFSPRWVDVYGDPELKKKYKGFRFCKTNRNPYDTSVVACLIFIHNLDKNIMKIKSDGKLTDWHDGYDLCKAVYPHMNFTIQDIDTL